MHFIVPFLWLTLGCATAPQHHNPPATAPASAPAPLVRHYHEGERIAYHMTATNQDHVQTLRYSADTSATVTRNAAGAWVEDFDWSNFIANDKPVPAAAGRQELSLDPTYTWSMPDMSKTTPALIGPVLDLMTFYVDLWLVMREGKLARVGDDLFFPRSNANSWADGSYVTLGEDAIDFDITLIALDRANDRATVLVRHVPPAESHIRLPAKWMEQPVADTPNNWVQVERDAANPGKWLAAVGKETFDVRLEVAPSDGRIISARMDNIIDVLERPCTSAAVDNPGEPVRYQIHRQIEIH
jgi:hypothetical protein